MYPINTEVDITIYQLVNNDYSKDYCMLVTFE